MTQSEKFLYNSLAKLKSSSEIKNFLFDLLTESEITEFSSRLNIARLLNEGLSQRAVATKAKVSVTTVTRVNKFLKRSNSGYSSLLNNHPL